MNSSIAIHFDIWY